MDFEKIIEKRNEANVFAKKLGNRLTELSLGYAVAEADVDETSLNPQQVVHGGLLYTLADVAGGGASCTHGYYVATANANFHYLRAGINTKKLIATATEVKAGHTIMVYEIDVKDQDGNELAKGLFTFVSLGAIDTRYEKDDDGGEEDE